MELSQTIQRARLHRGMTLSSLSRLAGVHKSTLSRWEAGKTIPNAPELRQVMDALALSPSQRLHCLQNLDAPRLLQLSREDGALKQYPVSLGELLRALRLRAGRTQAEVARAAGVTQALVSQWEAGDARPDIVALHALYRKLGASPEEIELLAASQWRSAAPLSMDPDGLREAVLFLEYHDSSPDRRLAYLALAARYGELYRRGKVSHTEAQSVWGTYGHYLCWRFLSNHESETAIEPALETIPRSRGELTLGHLEAFSAAIHLALNRKRRAASAVAALIPVLEDARTRVPPSRQSWWHDHRALLAEGVGDFAGVVAHSQESIQKANTEAESAARRLFLCDALVRQGRLLDAQATLRPTPLSETRAILHANNDLTHAKVYIGLGDRNEAARWLGELRQKIAMHGFTQLEEAARTIEARL